MEGPGGGAGGKSREQRKFRLLAELILECGLIRGTNGVVPRFPRVWSQRSKTMVPRFLGFGPKDPRLWGPKDLRLLWSEGPKN